jgi:hypothetical protein
VITVATTDLAAVRVGRIGPTVGIAVVSAAGLVFSAAGLTAMVAAHASPGNNAGDVVQLVDEAKMRPRRAGSATSRPG